MAAMQGLACFNAPVVSDEALVQRASAGNEEAFDLLVRRYEQALFTAIYHMVHNYHDACDIQQQVFLQLYLALASFHAGKSVRAWLFLVARYRCLDHLRRKSPVTFSELEGTGEDEQGLLPLLISDPAPLPEEVAEYHEIRQRCFLAIQALPPRYAQVLFLHSMAELSFAEIGLRLAIPMATAKTYFYRGRALLLSYLEAQKSGDRQPGSSLEREQEPNR
jgi:RNA polymerase sigma factor (sigma-70 family)